MMDEDRFWAIVDGSRQKAKGIKREEDEDFADVHERTLADELRRLTPAGVIAFDRRFTDLYHRAYRWDLWAAAYWMHGGCSDDGFMDFRSCLVSLGREWYGRILADPDVLAETIGRDDVPYLMHEGFMYVARSVYEELTGREMPDHDPPLHHPQEPTGEEIDHDDVNVMKTHFPRLVSRLPEEGV